MSEWFETSDGLWHRMWQRLVEGVTDPRSDARQLAFATGTATGPAVRTVVLRAADPQDRSVAIYTDRTSGKVAELEADPRAALLFWLAGDRLQVRLSCRVALQSGAAVEDIWNDLPERARLSYGITPSPGTPIPGPLDYRKSPDPADFTVLTCRIEHVDLVHLGDTHRRVAFARSRDWQSQWLAP